MFVLDGLDIIMMVIFMSVTNFLHDLILHLPKCRPGNEVQAGQVVYKLILRVDSFQEINTKEGL